MLAGGTVDRLTLIKKLMTFREPGDDFALACGSTVRGDIKAEISGKPDREKKFIETIEHMRSKKGLKKLKFKKLKLKAQHTIYQCQAIRKPGRIWYVILDEEPGSVCPTLLILGCSWNKDRQQNRISELQKRLGFSIEKYVFEEIEECDEFDPPSPGRSIELRYDTDIRPMINGTIDEMMKFAESEMGIKPTNHQLDTIFRPSMPIFVNGQAGTGKTVMLSLRVALGSWFEETETNSRILVTSMSDKVTEKLRDNVEMTNNAFRKHEQLGPKVENAKINLDKSLSKSNQENWKHTGDIDQFHLYRTFKKIQNELLDHSIKNSYLEENNVNFSIFANRFFSRRNYGKGFNAELAWYGIRSIIRGQCLKGKSGEYLTPADKELVTEREQFPVDKVDILFKCHDDYTNWLEKRRLHDDMDIARNTWQSLQNKSANDSKLSFDPFDMVYLDEAQDLTDLEFRILIELLKPEKTTSIILAGDPLQTINPSGFSWENLKDMMYNILNEKILSGKINLEDPMILNQNFRTPKNIVDIGNCVLNKRTNLTKHSPAVQLSNVPEGQAKLLVVTEKHKQQLNDLFEQDDVIKRFIIMNGSDKEGIKNLQEKDLLIEVDYDRSRVYSITQVKGLEAQKVHLYKFGASIPSTSSSIILQDKDRHEVSEEDRIPISYELNKLYIGLTRSRREILIIESERAAEHFWKAPMFENLELEIVKDENTVSKILQHEIDISGEPDHLDIARKLFQRYELDRDIQDLEWAKSSARKAEEKGKGDMTFTYKIEANLNEEYALVSEDKKKIREYWVNAALNHRRAQNHNRAYSIHLDYLIRSGTSYIQAYDIWKERPHVSKGRIQSEPLVLRLVNKSSEPNDREIINHLYKLPSWYDKQTHGPLLSEGLFELLSDLEDDSEQAPLIEKILTIDDLFNNSIKEEWLRTYSKSLDSDKYWKLAKTKDNLISNNLSNSQELTNKLATVADERLQSKSKDLSSYLSTLKTWYEIDKQAMNGKIPENLIKKMLSAEFSQLTPSSINNQDWPFELSQESHKKYIEFCRKSGYVLSGKLILLLENLGNDYWPNKLENSNIIELWKCFERPFSEFDKSIPDIEGFRDNDRLNSSIRTLVMSHVSLNSRKRDSSVNATRFGNLHASDIWEEACEDTNLMQALVGFFGETWKTSPEAFCSSLMESYEDNKRGAGYTLFASKYEEKALEILKQDPKSIARTVRSRLYGRIDLKRITEKKGFHSEHVTYFKIASELDDDKREFSKEEIKEIISDLDKIKADDELVNKAQESVTLGIDDIDEILIEEIDEKTKMERVLEIIQSTFTDKDRSIPKLVQILNNPTNMNTIITDEKLFDRLRKIAISWRRDDIQNSHDLLFYFHQSLFVYLLKLHNEEYKFTDSQSNQIDERLLNKIVMKKKNDLTRIEEIGKLYEDPGRVLETNHWWVDEKKYLSSSLMMFHHRLQIEKPTIEQLRKDISDLRLSKPPKNATRPKLIRKIYEQFEGADLFHNPNLQNAFDTII